jgi:hypothetical protein
MLIPAAGVAQREVGVENFRLVQQRAGITVDFDLVIGAKAAAPGTTFTIVPAITSDAGSVELTPVVVRGRRAEMLDRRGAAAHDPAATLLRNGASMKYHAVVPFEEWMPGASLVLKGRSEGCARAAETMIGTVADKLIVPVGDFTVTERITVPGTPLTTAEKLAALFTFVGSAPADGARVRNSSLVEGGLALSFHRDGEYVPADYRDNHRSMVDMLSVIEEIHRSPDSEIDCIVITGFASHDGAGDGKARLPLRRAEAVRGLIERHAPHTAGAIEVRDGGMDPGGPGEAVFIFVLYKNKTGH